MSDLLTEIVGGEPYQENIDEIVEGYRGRVSHAAIMEAVRKEGNTCKDLKG